MSSQSGEITITDAWYSNEERLVGLTKPSPPNLAGSASNFLSISLGGALLHKERIKLKRIQSSRGYRRSSIFGVVLHRKLNLSTSPWVKEA